MSDPIQVGIIGAAGRMGILTAQGLSQDGGFAIAALYDTAGGEITRLGVISAELPSLLKGGATHFIDFSLGQGVDAHGEDVLAAGKHYIVGATGYNEDTIARLSTAAEKHGVSCLIVPNFSIGANLMMEFATRAAAYYGTAEIVERHHAGKADAPSGTALSTAKQMTEARTMKSGPMGEKIAGVRGGEIGGVRIHAQRLPGILAEQQVIFGADGETLTIEHRTISRECYLPGIKLALLAMGTFTGLRMGLPSVMEGLA
jgi:4-hydroxy-tetrahydrodipicolinate reductase